MRGSTRKAQRTDLRSVGANALEGSNPSFRIYFIYSVRVRPPASRIFGGLDERSK